MGGQALGRLPGHIVNTPTGAAAKHNGKEGVLLGTKSFYRGGLSRREGGTEDPRNFSGVLARFVLVSHREGVPALRRSDSP